MARWMDCISLNVNDGVGNKETGTDFLIDIFFLPMKNLNFNGFMCVLNKAIFCLFSTGNFVRPYPIHRRIFQVVSVFFSNLFFLVASLASRDSIACYVNSLVRLSHLAFRPFWACLHHCSCPSVFLLPRPTERNLSGRGYMCPALFSVFIINWALPS